MLSVVAADGKAPNDYCKWSDKVVCGREPAPHSEQQLVMSFRPSNDDNLQPYTIFARAGGGGGHSLHIRNLSVRVLELIG